MKAEKVNREVHIVTTRSEALVLFECLSKVSDLLSENCDEAEAKIGFDLEAVLETVLDEPFLENYAELVKDAKSQVLSEV